MVRFVLEVLLVVQFLILIYAVKGQPTTTDEESVDDILLEMLQTEKLPYQIKGPRSKQDKIAIVGAGPAGVHMAYMLKMHGYKNVHILEKTSRIGGKSETIFHRDVLHDIGTVYLSPDYHNNVIALVKKYLPNDLMLFPPASIWLDARPGPITYQDYLAGNSMRFLKEINPKIVGTKLVQSITKYNTLHQNIFGKYEGEFMPEPNNEKMRWIRGNFLEFLQRNNLTLLVPIFQVTTTMQGYGRLDDLPALYGLMWNTPRVMNSFLGRLTGRTKQTGMYMLKSGFQKLWEKMVEVEDFKVTFDVKIHSVYRIFENNCQDIWLYKSDGTCCAAWEHYNFLIWSPEMKTSMSKWQNFIPEERFLFNSTVPMYFTVSIVDSKNEKRGLTPINYWIDNAVKNRESSVTAERDTHAVFQGYQGPLYQNKTFPAGSDDSGFQTSVVYQMSQKRTSHAHLEEIVTNHFKAMSSTQSKVVKLKTWRYFPRYAQKDIENGYLWKILKMQGKYGMWYVGSSVCFESVKSVVEYNKLIINNMIHFNVS